GARRSSSNAVRTMSGASNAKSCARRCGACSTGRGSCPWAGERSSIPAPEPSSSTRRSRSCTSTSTSRPSGSGSTLRTGRCCAGPAPRWRTGRRWSPSANPCTNRSRPSACRPRTPRRRRWSTASSTSSPACRGPRSTRSTPTSTRAAPSRGDETGRSTASGRVAAADPAGLGWPMRPTNDQEDERMSFTRINVDAGGTYPVLVGNGLLGELPELLGNRVEKVLVIHPRALRTTGEPVRDDLSAAGLDAVAAEIPDAEEAKHVQVAAFCWQVLGQSDFTRTDAIVTVGGGAVSDLGGFVAATWLRGIRVIHIPTTVLGMVDAAVGGKTGINTAEGKNLVGSFHAPAGVLVDLDTLGTLPEHELFTGLAEVVKTGFIADSAILDLVAAHTKDEIGAVDGPVLRELIERSIRVKAEVVSEDFEESGRREVLNYGHTLAHAIEHKERYQWRHGAAVSVGMVFAAEVAAMVKNLPEETVDLHRRLLGKLGLPTGYRSDVWPQLLETMKRDKKARGSMLRMVLLTDIGEPSTVEIPDASILHTAYQEVG